MESTLRSFFILMEPLRICVAAIASFTVLGLIFLIVYRKLRSNSQIETTASSSLSYDVFVSFCGGDDCRIFVGGVLKELKRKGIDSYIYNGIKKSHSMDSNLREARIVVIMLSRNYASSPRYLNELVEVMKCREELNQVVVPIFYELDPVDVRTKSGEFGRVLERTCGGKTMEDIERWRQALEQVATIAGYSSSNWDDEGDMIENIAADISNILKNSTPSSDLQGISNGLLRSVYIYCADTLQSSFASHLAVDFRRKCFAAFVNCNKNMDKIEGGSASVVVISKDYLSSPSCLDMLVRVLQPQRKTGQLVVPVFYGISQSDVVVQEQDSEDRIRKWSSALRELRDLPGHHSREEYIECEVVEEIVKDVYEKLFPAEQIGINSRLLEIERLLCKQPWGIRRIGIWGMPGIGKTTLAKAVFDQISGGYEASCFIKNFDKAFNEKGAHRLLKEHFGGILKDLPRICSSITRPSLPKDKINKKRTLVVLDDVHNPLVAESFLREFHWFGPGSLLIITSRDKKVYRHCHIKYVYEVPSLNESEALQVFSQCAFGKDVIEETFMELSKELIDYACGNPSALNFYGRELKVKKMSDIETESLRLKLHTPCKIHDLLKSSYETLKNNEKTIFLDIACFFSGENVDYVMQLLEGCGLFPHVGIDVLVEKCLVTISENRVEMHNITQDFGREIINGETVDVESRRRLWEPWSIKFLLEDEGLVANGDRALGTEDIEGIFLDKTNLLFDVKPNAFDNMLNLRFLKIHHSNNGNGSGLGLPKGLESLPYELRLLHWENYPLESLPQDFDPCHLVELNMPHSQLQKLWTGTKKLEMLKMVRLCHSQQLTEIDDICKAQNMELLDLEGCTKLHIFPSMCQQQRLRVVNLSGCGEIKIFPEVSPSIEELHLQGTSIRELPISTVTLSPQVKLDRELSINILTKFSAVSEAFNHERLTSMVKAVSSTQHLGKLVCLNMKDCLHLQSLPSMVDLESLKVLNLSGCSELNDILDLPRNLKELYLADTAIKELPQLPWSIEILNAHGCGFLISIPLGFEQLPRYYTFSNCFSLSAQVVNIFVKETLTNVEHMVREYQEEQKLNISLAFSLTVPSFASEKFSLEMQLGSSVVIQLGSSWRSMLGVVILVEVAFSEDYLEASGFGISCVCRWKDKERVRHKLEKNFHGWTLEKGVRKDHVFVFCDLNMYTDELNDSSILADLVIFEFFTVNNQKKYLNKCCTVTKCGVYVITAANQDTSLNMTPYFPASEYLDEVSDHEVREVLTVIHQGLDEDERSLFLYIASIFNDDEADLLAPDLDISYGLKVLASNSLIYISPYGVIVRPGLLQKIRREIVHRQHTIPGSPLDSDFVVSVPSLHHTWKYDVFTSFSGEDDCDNKFSNLVAEFKGIVMSTSKEKMKRSKSVTSKLVQVIRESRGSIVVLSKNYASSSRCLDELVEIMNCNKEFAQKVVAIFYNVVPSDVSLLSGDFGKAFKTTCIGRSEDEKLKWARALADLANIAGVNTHKWDNEANIFKKYGCDFPEKTDGKTSEVSDERMGVVEDVTDIGAWESLEVEKRVEISASLRKAGQEINARMVAMPVAMRGMQESPHRFREEGKVIRSESWSPSFLDRVPFAELYTGETPAAFLQGLGNIRSMLRPENSE